MQERLRNKQIIANEIGTVERALDGVVSLAAWAYEQQDADARRAIPHIQAVVELVADRMKELHRGLVEE